MPAQAPSDATARLDRSRSGAGSRRRGAGPHQRPKYGRDALAPAGPHANGRAWSDRLDSTLVRLLPLLALFLVLTVILDPGRPSGDEGPIVAAAHRLLQGRYAVIGTMDGTKFLWHGPGLPALLAPLVALGVPLGGLRVMSPLLMFAAALMFYRLLSLRLSPRGSLIGAYALGLYLPACYVLGTVAKEPLALLLSISALDGTARYLSYGRYRHAVLAGLSLAGLAMTRLEYGWVITGALAAGLLWWLIAHVRHGPAQRALTARRWTVICAVGMLACTPWLAYTYAITGHVFYWGNSGGISLYWMSSPSSTQLGEWHASHTVYADPALAGYRPFFHYLATLGPVPRDLKLQHVAVAQALGHPAKYTLNLLANVGRMFFGFPFSFTLSPAVIAGLVAINGALLAGVLAAGRFLLRVRSSLPPETVPFLLLFAVGLVVHLLPTAEPRMMVPLIPVPLWLIGLAFYRRSPVPGRMVAAVAPAVRPAAPIEDVPSRALTPSGSLPRAGAD
jgi:hypothetical protein